MRSSAPNIQRCADAVAPTGLLGWFADGRESYKRDDFFVCSSHASRSSAQRRNQIVGDYSSAKIG